MDRSKNLTDLVYSCTKKSKRFSASRESAKKWQLSLQNSVIHNSGQTSIIATPPPRADG